MDLPKELRLMVYDFLPIKTTYHEIAANGDEFVQTQEHYELFLENTNNITFSDGTKLPQASIVMLQRTFPSLSLLMVSKEIASEANVILQAKIQVIRELPIQLIANSLAMVTNEMELVMRCFSHSICGAFRNHKIVLEKGHLNETHENTGTPLEQSRCTIYVAIRNSYMDRETASVKTCRARMVELMDEQCEIFYSNIELYWQGEVDERPTRCLHIRTRLALLSPNEVAALNGLHPFKSKFMLRDGDKGPELRIDSGEDIKTEEWELNWAEGERC
jgi:hypothetical protein